jgi:hypothetical protein
MRLGIASRVVALMAGVAALEATLASQWVVDDDGTADFRSIQAAIDAAYVQAGDTILVKPGTYVGNVYLDDKELEIRSERGPFVTILDARAAGSVVSLYNRTSATVLEGFTITGGRGQTGGGVWIYGGGPVVTRNIIQGNAAVGGYLGYGYGGGIEIYGSAALVTRNVIRGNTALDGGGGIDLYYAGASTAGTCCPTLSQNTIVENAVTGPGGRGGAILSFASSPRITSSILSGNQAASGGGIYTYRVQGNPDAPDATGNVFFANAPEDAAANGGWHLPASNQHADPRLGAGEGSDVWPRSDSPALDSAEPSAPLAPDLTGVAAALDSDLDGVAWADRGALESRGEITTLRASRDPVDPASTLLTWDDARSPAVVFRVHARDGDPFVAEDGACLAWELSAPVFVDAIAVAPGEIRFYLVTGRGTVEGSGGFRSDGAERPSSACSP